uniref:Uncharacterized protein n=1 Tax=Ditylum brightwellii TaxID=49249 RepID=A0A7S1Z688_9STRA
MVCSSESDSMDVDSAREHSSIVQTHRLLARWLAPANGPNFSNGDENGHPICDEVVANVVWSYLLRLIAPSLSSSVGGDEAEGGETSEGKQLRHMLSLLAGLLFDQRTSVDHRRNICSVFCRILSEKQPTLIDKNKSMSHSSRPLSDKLRRMLRVSAQDVLCKEFNRIIKFSLKENKASRKRRRHERISELRRSTMALVVAGLSPDDARSIGYVIENLAVDGVVWSKFEGFFLKEFRAYCSRIASTKYNKEKGFWRKNSSLSIVMLSFIMGSLKVGCCRDQSFSVKDVEKMFHERTSVSILQLLGGIIALVSQELKQMLEKSPSRPDSDGCIASVIHLLQCAMKRLGRSFPPTHLQGVCGILMLCTDAIRQKRGNAEGGGLCSFIDYIVNEIVLLLSTIGSALTVSCTEAILDQIASTFYTLFSQGGWFLTAPLMTALEKFASSLPSNHQGILPKCIPEKSKLLLQCRFKGKVFDESRLKVEEHNACQIEESRLEESDFLLRSCDPPHKMRRKIYAGASDVVIASGSRVATVDTGGKSAAIVIMPPDGDLSVDEILAAISSATSNRNTAVQMNRINRVILTDHDRGCRLKVQGET